MAEDTYTEGTETPEKPPKAPTLRATGLPTLVDEEPGVSQLIEEQPPPLAAHPIELLEDPDNPVNLPPFLPGHPILLEDTDIPELEDDPSYQMDQNQPLMHALASMTVLREEYERGSPSFLKQIDTLIRDGYDCIRRTRGDGDCFYRSVAYAFVESLLLSPDHPIAVASALSQINTGLSMVKAVFPSMVYEDFLECLTALIENIIKPDEEGRTLTPEGLLDVFQQPGSSNYIIGYLRLLTSAQIRDDPSNAEFLHDPETYEPLDLETFCRRHVEATGREADHIQIQALSRALKISVKIAYLDGRDETGKVTFHDLEYGEPTLVLLYRPGHYDVLTRSNNATNTR